MNEKHKAMLKSRGWFVGDPYRDEDIQHIADESDHLMVLACTNIGDDVLLYRDDVLLISRDQRDEMSRQLSAAHN